VHAAHEKGMGSKAMLLLATLATEAELLHVLRSLLQPRDYACLIAIARKAVSACPNLRGLPSLVLLQTSIPALFYAGRCSPNDVFPIGQPVLRSAPCVAALTVLQVVHDPNYISERNALGCLDLL